MPTDDTPRASVKHHGTIDLTLSDDDDDGPPESISEVSESVEDIPESQYEYAAEPGTALQPVYMASSSGSVSIDQPVIHYPTPDISPRNAGDPADHPETFAVAEATEGSSSRTFRPEVYGSTRLMKGTCGELIPQLDEIYDGETMRSLLRQQEEDILATLGYTNADHMVMITWNRFYYEHGPMQHSNQKWYITDYFAQYGSLVLHVEGTLQAMKDHLYALWIQGQLQEAVQDGDFKAARIKAVLLWRDLNRIWGHAAASAERGRWQGPA